MPEHGNFPFQIVQLHLKFFPFACHRLVFCIVTRVCHHGSQGLDRGLVATLVFASRLLSILLGPLHCLLQPLLIIQLLSNYHCALGIQLRFQDVERHDIGPRSHLVRARGTLLLAAPLFVHELVEGRVALEDVDAHVLQGRLQLLHSHAQGVAAVLRKGVVAVGRYLAVGGLQGHAAAAKSQEGVHPGPPLLVVGLDPPGTRLERAHKGLADRQFHGPAVQRVAAIDAGTVGLNQAKHKEPLF
mmetsp:Transcript_4122/g.12058  ORF Transcript_4122/g.12058 Transcript_4122/m.12058 type:complete len:243 (-) Transcript_4122:2173-2901(-)